jgi:hypothetical protein
MSSNCKNLVRWSVVETIDKPLAIWLKQYNAIQKSDLDSYEKVARNSFFVSTGMTFLDEEECTIVLLVTTTAVRVN